MKDKSFVFNQSSSLFLQTNITKISLQISLFYNFYYFYLPALPLRKIEKFPYNFIFQKVYFKVTIIGWKEN